MKKLLILIITFYFCMAAKSQSLYDQPLHDIEGNSVNLKKFFGKKIVFIILPLSNEDSSKKKEIDSFLVSCGTKALVIGILSREDGYTESQKAALQQMYSEANIILSEGMYTKKVSGANQSPLMQWLTSRSKNFRSDADATAGQAFFIGEPGNLIVVAKPEARLNSAGTLFILNKAPGH